MNKIISILIVAFVYCNLVFSQTVNSSYPQNLPTFTPGSPQASAIVKYQNYPVDYRTGIPNIEIPLFSIDTKLGRIPFSLSYHPGSLRSSELTGPVGYGWTLTPNIGISRSVNGKDDEQNLPKTPADLSHSTLESLASPTGLEQELDDYYYSLLDKSGSFLLDTKKSAFVTNPYEPIQITKYWFPGVNSYAITDEKGVTYTFGSTGASTSSSNNVEYTSSSSFYDFTGSNSKALVGWKIAKITSADKSEVINFIYNTPIRWTMPILTYQYKIGQYNRVSGIQSPGLDFMLQSNIGLNSYLDKPSTTIRKTRYNSRYNYENVGAEWEKLMLGGGMSNSYIPQGESWASVFDLRPQRFIYGPKTLPEDSYMSLSKTELNDFCHSNVSGKNWDATLASIRNIDEALMSEISFNSGKIVFSYDNYRLKYITVYSKLNDTYTPVKIVKLYQHEVEYSGDLYTVNTGDKMNRRAILDSVIISDVNDTQNNLYKIDYSNNMHRLYLGNIGLDIWGNTDGSDIHGFNGDKVPAMDITLSDCSALSLWRTDACGAYPSPGKSFPTYTFVVGSKQLHPLKPSDLNEETKPGLPSHLIRRIVYPTGGSAEFEFEKNQFKLSYDDPNIYGTGVRIKSIKYLSGIGQDSLRKNYSYGINENGLGLIKFIPSRSDFISSQYFCEGDVPYANIRQIITVSANPYSNLLFDGGAAVRYTQVTEYTGTPNKNMGKTIYTYSNPQELYKVPYFPLAQKRKDDWKYNLLLSEAHYEFLNNKYSLLRKKKYDYMFFNKEVLKSASASPRIVSLTGQNLSNIHSPTELFFYKIDEFNTGGQRISMITDSVFYDNTNPVASSICYQYDPITLQVINETKVNSAKDTTVMEYKYPRNFLSKSPYQAMVNNNIISPVIEYRQKKNNQFIQSISTEYKNWQGFLFAPALYLKKSGNNPVDTILSVTAYDIKGNVLEQEKFKGVKEVYLWSYNGQYPIAKIENANFTEVKAALDDLSGAFITQLGNKLEPSAADWVKLSALRTSLAKARVSTYTYKLMVGMTSQTDPRGVTEYYGYDGLQRLEEVLDFDKNVLTKYQYHYSGQTTDIPTTTVVYKNTTQNSTFTRMNCPSGCYGGDIIYTVPAGKYSSSISQIDADLKALNDIEMNGQNYANQQGTCIVDGIYVSLCADSFRGAINGDYKETYATFSIRIFSDSSGNLLKQTPVVIGVSYNGQVSDFTVTGSYLIGERLISKEQVVVPTPGYLPNQPPLTGSFTSYPVNIVARPAYQQIQLNSCSTLPDSGLPTIETPTPIGEGGSGQTHLMVRFDTQSAACAYTHGDAVLISPIYYFDTPESLVKCFTNLTKQNVVSDGYYTHFKSVNGFYAPNRWYHIIGGTIMSQGTCP